MQGDERVFRARVLDYVGGTPFPATKDNLVAQARRSNVASDVLSALLRLPDRSYGSPREMLAEVARLGQTQG